MKIGDKYKDNSMTVRVAEILPHTVGYIYEEHKGMYWEEISTFKERFKPLNDWHDITPGEFKEYWEKEVWFWDDNPKYAFESTLDGFKRGEPHPYSSKARRFIHASITKPE